MKKKKKSNNISLHNTDQQLQQQKKKQREEANTTIAIKSEAEEELGVPSLISLTVSEDVKHHDCLLTRRTST